MNNKPVLHMDQPARYCIKLQGRVSADWADWLSEAAIEYVDAQPVMVTCICGVVRDQAALFGLLSQVRDLGAPLISVDVIAEGSKLDECD